MLRGDWSLPSFIRSGKHTCMNTHAHTFVKPRSREREETHQVIKALALPWKLKEWPFALCLSVSLALSLWLLSGFLVFSFHLSICLPGSQPTVHCACDYPTVGNCSSGTLAAISLPIQMRKYLPAERQEGVWFTFRCLCYMDRELIITRLCAIRPTLKILAFWKGPVYSPNLLYLYGGTRQHIHAFFLWHSLLQWQ